MKKVYRYKCNRPHGCKACPAAIGGKRLYKIIKGKEIYQPTLSGKGYKYWNSVEKMDIPCFIGERAGEEK